MDYNKILLSVHEELKKEGIDCAIHSLTDQPATLLIYAGLDKEKRTQLIEIKVLADSMGKSSKSKDANYVGVQLNAFFPFNVEDDALVEVAQFLHFLNFQVEVPGFYLNYIDKTIVYRYVLLSESEHFPKKILLSLIGIAMFFQDVFGQTLENLATGKAIFVDLLEEIKEILANVGGPERL